MVEVVAAAYLQPRGFLQKLRMIDDEKKRFHSQRRYITGSMWQPPPRSAPSNLQICFFGGWWPTTALKLVPPSEPGVGNLRLFCVSAVASFSVEKKQQPNGNISHFYGPVYTERTFY